MNERNSALLRYLDGELSPRERADFEARLARSPALRRQLLEMREVGVLLRGWAEQAGQGTAPLLEPTLKRIERAELRRRGSGLGVAVAALGLLLWPLSSPDRFPSRSPLLVTESTGVAAAAAIERLEAPDHHAQVFVVGSSSTPVVWLDENEDEPSDQQDPG